LPLSCSRDAPTRGSEVFQALKVFPRGRTFVRVHATRFQIAFDRREPFAQAHVVELSRREVEMAEGYLLPPPPRGRLGLGDFPRPLTSSSPDARAAATMAWMMSCTSHGRSAA